MPDSAFIDPKVLRPGPIRNKSLPPELLEPIGLVYDHFGPYLGTTLEQFEIRFMRDMDPNQEVAVWLNMVAAWLDYHQDYLGDRMLPDDEEKKLLIALISISTGVEDVEKMGVPIETGRRLRACYDGLGKE